MQKKAIIIGAGPAGLTAAYELLSKTDIKPIVFESANDVGGLSKTVDYKGNKIDIGGHRFFSKSDVVMAWWQNILPISDEKNYSNEDVLLVRNRLSRIFYLRKFFDYPISLKLKTFNNLGFRRVVGIAWDYCAAALKPIKPEKTLEDFFINRFGRRLFQTFFKDYTEKVWGVPCEQISAEWGAQRIKGLSIKTAIIHAFKKILAKADLAQKQTETSLIENFLYPKYGPGQMWQKVAELIVERGGEVHLNHEVIGFDCCDSTIKNVLVKNTKLDQILSIEADYVLSSMPIQQLAKHLTKVISPEALSVAEHLVYRDFITVGLLVKKLTIGEIQDNWIYIQENDVRLGRLQIFNNWSEFLVSDKNLTWLGLEYFCNQGDSLWSKTDDELLDLAKMELAKLQIIDLADCLDGTVIRAPKAYPAYFGSYQDFPLLKDELDKIENLFLIGRNGMHKYNNQDHSMLSAMAAVANIKNGTTSKANIWSVNAEQTYHETKKI